MSPVEMAACNPVGMAVCRNGSMSEWRYVEMAGCRNGGMSKWQHVTEEALLLFSTDYTHNISAHVLSVEDEIKVYGDMKTCTYLLFCVTLSQAASARLPGRSVPSLTLQQLKSCRTTSLFQNTPNSNRSLLLPSRDFSRWHLMVVRSMT